MHTHTLYTFTPGKIAAKQTYYKYLFSLPISIIQFISSKYISVVC